MGERLRRLRRAVLRSDSGGLLARTRALFVTIVLLAALQMLFTIAFRGVGDPTREVAAYATLLALAIWWSRPRRVAKSGAASEVLEAAGHVVVLAGIADVTVGLALFFIALAYRCLFGNVRRTAFRIGTYIVALVTAYALTGVLADSMVDLLFMVPTVFMVGVLTYSLGEILRRQERAAARERVLVEASASLVASETLVHASELIADVALALARTAPAAPEADVCAEVWLPGGDGLWSAAAARDGSAGSARSQDATRRLGAAALGRLQAPGVVSLQLLREIDPAAAADLADFVESEADGLVAPLVVQERCLGLIVVCGAEPALESAGALDTLAAEAALCLDRIRLTEDLRNSEKRFRSLVLHASDVITAVDADLVITYQSPSVRELLQMVPETLVGVPLELLVHPDDASDLLAALRSARNPTVARIEARLRRADGSHVQVEVVANNLLSDPDVGMIVLNIRDIGDRKAFEEQLAHRAFHDALTGLPNRALFTEHAQQALARTQRGGPPMCVLMLDLDDFKRVNDTLGHSAGDRLLAVLAERLRGCVRPADTVARLGGDEFALIVLADAERAMLVADRVLDAMSKPVDLGADTAAIGASIGVAMSETGEEPLEELLRMADFAMYAAKSGGKSRAAVYEPSMRREVLGANG